MPFRLRLSCLPCATRDLHSSPTRRSSDLEHVVEVPDEPHHRHDRAGDELGAEAGPEQPVVVVVKALAHGVLGVERGDEVVAGEGLLDLPAELTGGLPLRLEVRLGALGDGQRGPGRDRHGHQRDERELPGDDEHHRHHAQHGDTEVITWDRVCWRVWATLSMSLVTRESTSPRAWESSSRSGSRSILACTSRRNRKAVRWTIPARMRPWIHRNAADATYTSSTSRIIWARAPKSMPCPGTTSIPLTISATCSWPPARSASTACSWVVPGGSIRPTTPLNTMSVARPSSAGPSTCRPTATTASTTTTTRRTRSTDIERSRRRNEGPKFCDFWPGGVPRSEER